MLTHTLHFGFSVPHSERTLDGWKFSWQGCAVMGILNVTPDSFSDGGKHAQLEAAVARARQMTAEGALIIDIGGESTRPNAQPVDAVSELDRVLPVVRALQDQGVLLSVDTMKAEVAQESLKAGAHLINDVTGLRDPEMLDVCASKAVPVCVMHMQGQPSGMQDNPDYADVVREVSGYLLNQAEWAKLSGVPSVLIDPGIGFGKNLEHNLALLKALEHFANSDYPLLVGASRKRLIDWLADVPQATQRDAGSLALHLHAARAGAALVRVHAVAEHVQALKVWQALDG